MTFFSVYFGNRQKPRGKFGKTFFLFFFCFENAWFFAENPRQLARRPFLVFFWKPSEKNFGGLFLFSLENTCALCPYGFALASSIPVLGLERICPREVGPCWPWPQIFLCAFGLSLEGCVLHSTLVESNTFARTSRRNSFVHYNIHKQTGDWQFFVFFFLTVC